MNKGSRIRNGTPGATDSVRVAAAPPENLCRNTMPLRVGDLPVPVYSCRVSAVPFNQVWPGYQRPLDQTETAGSRTGT